MSGPAVGRALREHFDSVRQRELRRLHKKLRGLTETERQSIDAVTADVIHALARLPEQALANEAPATTVEAVVRLFALTE
jgi:glutamyl-tRNA reductase